MESGGTRSSSYGREDESVDYRRSGDTGNREGKKKWEAISVVSLFRGGTRPGVRQRKRQRRGSVSRVSYCLGPRCI